MGKVSKRVCCWCFTMNSDGPALRVGPTVWSVRWWWLCLVVPLLAEGSSSSTKKQPFRELWDSTSMAVLERGTKTHCTFHSPAETPGNSFHHFQTDLTVNFWDCAELVPISQDLLVGTWTSYLLPVHWFPCCQGERQVLHFTGVLYLASELLST